jgi:hypothetical protein
MIIEEMLFEHLSAEVSSTGPQVSVTNIICSLGGDYGEGKASGWMVIDSDGGMAGRVVTQMDPHLLLPMLERIEWKYTCKLIRRFEWPATKPLIDSAFELTPGDDSTFRCESLFSMRDYSYRDVSNDSCDGFLSVNFSPTSGVVSVDNITIGIDERVVVGGFAFDGKRDVVTYRAISDADPKAFFQMVGLFGKDAMENWSFPGVTRFISEGVVDFEKSDGNDTRVLAEIESSGMGIGRLVADTCRFNVNMNGSTCRFTNIEGTIWDGRFVARSDIVFAEDEDVLTFGCAVDDGDFSKVVESLSAEPNNMKGKFSVEMDGRFLLSSNIMDTLTAAGRMSVADGKVFELPIFGGLTEIMAKIIPGLDFVIAQSDMKAEFKVKDGGVSSEKISIVGDVLSLEADGTAGFDGELDFAVQLKLMNEHTVVAKLVRAVTWPISKLMEFRLKGNGDDVQWYPINFSSELLEKVGLKRSDDSGE